MGPAKMKPPVVPGTSADGVVSPVGKATPLVRGPLGEEIRPAEVAEVPADFRPPGAGPGSAGPAGAGSRQLGSELVCPLDERALTARVTADVSSSPSK